MNVLSIDTSSSLLGVGLQTDTHYYEVNQDVGLHHTENLLSEVRFLLEKSNLSVPQLDLIVVSKGPGSFTGLRIGMSTAKGLSFGSGVPVVSVPTLEMYVYGHSIYSEWVVPVIDARKNRVYTAFYKNGNRYGDIFDIAPELLLKELSNYTEVLLTGPFAAHLHELNTTSQDSIHNYVIDPLHAGPHIYALLNQGIHIFKRQGGNDKNTGPLYIRPSEAELSLQQKVATEHIDGR
jgi:tRNA threonylcarbamoyladenosine biosynthesis protein TsaB